MLVNELNNEQQQHIICNYAKPFLVSKQINGFIITYNLGFNKETIRVIEI